MLAKAAGAPVALECRRSRVRLVAVQRARRTSEVHSSAKCTPPAIRAGRRKVFDGSFSGLRKVMKVFITLPMPCRVACTQRAAQTHAVSVVNLVALVDWQFIKLHKRQPGERDIPVPAKARPGGHQAHMIAVGFGNTSLSCQSSCSASIAATGRRKESYCMKIHGGRSHASRESSIHAHSISPQGA